MKSFLSFLFRRCKGTMLFCQKQEHIKANVEEYRDTEYDNWLKYSRIRKTFRSVNVDII